MEHSFTIQTTHASLKGHFPNNPVIPGVIILDEIINIIKTIKPEFTVNSIPMVKFIHPLLPEQKVIIEITEKTETTISFSCSHINTKIVTGQLALTRLS
jgi:3-hydroxyacyl-[acyl-carrier-protein] dehydratase